MLRDLDKKFKVNNQKKLAIIILEFNNHLTLDRFCIV